jgi:hypothetical protein
VPDVVAAGIDARTPQSVVVALFTRRAASRRRRDSSARLIAGQAVVALAAVELTLFI